MEPAKLETSPTTCIVGCKLPNGYKLEIFSDSKKNPTVISAFTIKGANTSHIIGGYGLTENIPTAFMTEWLKRNAQLPAVVNGSIFMHTTVDGARAAAREKREVRSGLEAINPIEDAKRHKIDIDKESIAAYNKQVAENPMRGRQLVE